MLAMALLAGLSAPAAVRITQGLINAALGVVGGGLRGFAQVLPWLVAFTAATLADATVLWRLQDLLDDRVRDHLTHALQGARLEKAVRLPLLAFERSETFDMLERADGPGHKAGQLFLSTMNTLQYGMQAAGVVFLFGALGWWVPPVLLVAVALQSARELEGNRQWTAFTYDRTEEQRRLFYLTDLLTGRSQQKEIRVFGVRGALTARWQAQRVRLRKAMTGEKLRITRLNSLANAIALGLSIAVAFGLVVRLGTHAISPGAFVALFGGLGLLQSLLGPLAQSVVEMQSGTTDVGYVRTFLEIPEEGLPSGGRRGFPAPLRDGLRCTALTFVYPGRREPVLRGLDLHLGRGEIVGLVGENGSGKSTLAKCLLGLYPPSAGRITVDGVDYRDLEPESLRAAVTAAYQDYAEFGFTAAESIGLGDVARMGDRAAIVAAAGKGGAEPFISALPQGYDTPVGHVLDGAADLSGGQWQRIAISRALFREAQVVVLDEPTAAVDPKGEAEMYARFRAVLAGRTALWITHRLGSARMADRICVLRGGRIVEEGRHDDLVAAGGEYARMWDEQARWYR